MGRLVRYRHLVQFYPTCTLILCAMSTVKKVVELLFGENDFNSEKEAILAASILHSRKCWNTEVYNYTGTVSYEGIIYFVINSIAL